MPRNSAGVYALPTGINPVVPLTTITSSWANPTMSDLAAALTDSLSRSGLGGMTAPFKLFDGAVATPGLGFLNEPGLGFYRPSVGVGGFAVGGVETARYVSNRWTFNTEGVFKQDVILKTPTVRSVILYNNADTNFFLSPSTTADGEDWDFGKGLALNKSTGDLAALKALSVSGGFYALTTLTVQGAATFNGTLAGAAAAFNNITVTLDVAVQRDLYVTRHSYAKDFSPTPFTGNVLGGIAINYNANGQMQFLTCTGTTVLYPTGMPRGAMMRLYIDGLQSFGCTFDPASVFWPMGVVPNLAAGPLKVAIVTILFNGGVYLASASVY